MCSELNKVSIKDSKKVFLHELAHHLPYGTLSVACALLLMSMIDVLFHSSIASSIGNGSCCSHGNYALDTLFHVFHFVHLVFAASGAMLTFYRYSNKENFT